MKFKEVILLYIGCKMYHDVPKDIWTLTIGDIPRNFREVVVSHPSKPVLRPLSDYTELESCEIANYVSTFDGKNVFERMNDKRAYKIQITDAPELVLWLCNKYFDLFGLIESGEAIDATKLPENPYKVTEQ